MPKRPRPFTQSDLQRALNAAKKSGHAVRRFEIDPKTGKIIVVIKDGAGPDDDGERNEWDEELNGKDQT